MVAIDSATTPGPTTGSGIDYSAIVGFAESVTLPDPKHPLFRIPGRERVASWGWRRLVVGQGGKSLVGKTLGIEEGVQIAFSPGLKRLGKAIASHGGATGWHRSVPEHRVEEILRQLGNTSGGDYQFAFSTTNLAELAGKLGLSFPAIEPDPWSHEAGDIEGLPFAPCDPLTFNRQLNAVPTVVPFDDLSLRMAPTFSEVLCSSRRSIPHFNEYALVPMAGFGDWIGAYTFLYDTLIVSAARRTTMFSESWMHRIYTLALPPAIGRAESSFAANASEDRHSIAPDDTPAPAFLFFPSITLLRSPIYGRFRRTITCAISAVPVTVKGGKPLSFSKRYISARELHDTLSTSKLYVRGPLVEFIHSGSKTKRVLKGLDDRSLLDCFSANLGQTLDLAIHRTIELLEPEASQADLGAVLSHLRRFWSKVSCCIDPLLWEADLSQFNSSPRVITPRLRSVLSRLVTKEGLLSTQLWDKQPGSASYEQMFLGGINRTDRRGLLFYDDDGPSLVHIRPTYSEHFPETSILRTWPSLIWMAQGTTAVKSLIHSLNDELRHSETGSSLFALSEADVELVSDLEEMRSMELDNPFYSQPFRQLLEVSGANIQYKELREELTSLRTNRSIVEQHRHSINLVVLTGIIALLTTGLISLGLAPYFGSLVTAILVFALPVSVAAAVGTYWAYGFGRGRSRLSS